MRVCWGYRGFILLPIWVLGDRQFLRVPGTTWEVQMVGYNEGIQVTWVPLGRYSKVPLCSIRKVAKAADGADWDISSSNHPCTLATEWSDQLGVNRESARPQEDMPSPQRQKPQFTAAACLPHTHRDTIQWDPASATCEPARYQETMPQAPYTPNHAKGDGWGRNSRYYLGQNL